MIAGVIQLPTGRVLWEKRIKRAETNNYNINECVYLFIYQADYSI